MSRRLILPGAALLVAIVLALVAFTGDDSPVTVDASGLDASGLEASSAPASQAEEPDASTADPDRPGRDRMAPLRIDAD